MSSFEQRNRPPEPDENASGVEFMEILFLLWNRRYLILAGTLIITLAAGVLTYIQFQRQPERYRGELTMIPPVKGVDKNGGPIFLVSMENLMAYINSEIRHRFPQDNGRLSLSTRPSTYILTIRYESTSEERALEQIAFLKKKVAERYQASIDRIRLYYDHELSDARRELSLLRAKQAHQRRSFEQGLMHLKQDLLRYREEYELLHHQVAWCNKNLASIGGSRQQMAAQNREIRERLDTLLNPVDTSVKADQTNMLLMASDVTFRGHMLENELFELVEKLSSAKVELEIRLLKLSKKIRKAELQIQEMTASRDDFAKQSVFRPALAQFQAEIFTKERQIASLEREKDSVDGIRIVETIHAAPVSKRNPLRRNIFFAVAAGLFFMVGLALFIDYWVRIREKFNS